MTASLDDQKAVAYYTAAVTAWFTSALEYDKSILTLSAGGIGLHLTLLTTVGLRSPEALVLYIAAIVCFTAALLAVLRVFRRNQSHIEDVLAGRVAGKDPSLARLDAFAILSFGTGVVFTAVVGISAAIHSFSDREKAMSEKQQPQQAVPLRESVNGAGSLQPPSRVEKSFNGAASLQPTAQPAAQPPASQAQTPAAQIQPQAQPPSASGTK